MKVGIDAVSYSVPKLFMPFAGRWAERRADVFSQGDVDGLVAKVTAGIGMSQMAIPDAHEDIVTLAANAIRQLMERRGISLAEVSHVLFATEGGVDHSKSASAYVLGLLADYFSADAGHIASVELKFACAASSYAIEYAQSLIRSKMASRRYVIVVASDIARYELETPGEYTQGAGAVAMAICEDPQILEFDEFPMACASADERDFFRPLFRDFPTVDGKYSVEVYLNLVERAFARFTQIQAEAHKMSARDLLGQSGALLFHVPFPKMAEYIASRILLPHFQDVRAMTSDERVAAERDFRKSKTFLELFAEKVEPSLTISRSVGNVYSGSLPLALASLLSQAPEQLKALSGKRAVFLAYGSGATARVYGGTFSRSLGKSVLPMPLSQIARQPVSLEEYERLHAHSEVRFERNGDAMVTPLGLSVLKPRDEFVYLGMKALPISELGLRLYKYQS